MKQENYKITVKDKKDQPVEVHTTGKMYDAHIKAFQIQEELKIKYPSFDVIKELNV